jgi:hypothetical protein
MVNGTKIDRMDKIMGDLLTQRLEDKPLVIKEETKKGLKEKPVDEQALKQAKL